VDRSARTIVNEEDAFGGRGRDVLGQRTELYGGAHSHAVTLQIDDEAGEVGAC